MTIRILTAADRPEWNRFAAAHPQCHFMQTWEWAELKASQGWEPYFFALEDAGRIIGGTLVQKKRLPVIGKSLLYSPRGPLLAANSPGFLTELVGEIRQFADRNRAIFWRTDPYLTHGEAGVTFPTAGFVQVHREWSYWNAPKYLMHLPLEGTAEDVFKKLGSTARNETRQAVKSGVTVDYGTVDDLDDFFALMIRTAEKKKIPHHDLVYYRTLYETLGKSGMAQLFLARREGMTGSAGISLRFGSTAWLLYLASDYSVKYSNRALQWEMVKWAVEAGCTRYDFRGTACNFPPRETDPGYGVYKFKKSFGADTAVMAGYYDLVCSPTWYRMFRSIEQVVLPRIMDIKAQFGL
jgi:lipid II:glycine glycyltransferase (peptidoglycan interpeptide bridge formation enzyme)